jgi:hypothetical protein
MKMPSGVFSTIRSLASLSRRASGRLRADLAAIAHKRRVVQQRSPGVLDPQVMSIGVAVAIFERLRLAP